MDAAVRVQAYRIAEHKDVRLPIMICQDGFITSHAVENIELLEDDIVKTFVGEYEPEHYLLKDNEPFAAWKDSFIHNAFENAGATCSGVEAAYRALKKKGKVKNTHKFITFGGDGGTYDIGFQSLSGAMERNHDMVYVCYNNGAYMNTCIQRSSATPMYADTTTTPVGSESDGKAQNRKDLTQVIAAHNIPYVAQTTFVQNFKDLHTKAEKAIYTEGAAFLNVMAPCPRGWRYNTPDILEICQLAVDTCFWPLFEVIDGKWIVNYVPKKKLPIEDFLRPQGRFKHLFKPGKEELIARIQAEVDRKWEELLTKANY